MNLKTLFFLKAALAHEGMKALLIKSYQEERDSIFLPRTDVISE